MVTRYGTDVFVTSLLLLIVLALLVVWLVPTGFIRWGILLLLAAVAGLVINFFRDPDRTVPQQPGIVVSPADGKVVLIKELYESEFLQEDAWQVSIFMSPLDVHVNRFPLSGIVSYFRYIEGEYLVAFDDKSSERNERTHIGIDSDGFKVLFKQIAGAVARRIVAPITIGQKAVRGERFGMIKFGSRLDVFIPKSSTVRVQLNQRTVAGETILATYNTPGRSDSLAAESERR